MIIKDIYKNLIVQNENWEIYLLINIFLLNSRLQKILLKFFFSFSVNNFSNAYVAIIIYDKISTSSVILLHYIFHSNILVSTKILLMLP